jgi:chorismate dehydratase
MLNPDQIGIEISPVSDCDLRVGAVSYLNTKPLIFGLQALAPKLRVELAPPAELAYRLGAGMLDAALVPVIEYFSRPEYGLAAESAICGDGEIRSVLLFAREPVERARSVCLDPESMTTNALVRVLCRERFRIEPRWTERAAGSDPADLLERCEADAAVVIGNAALRMSGRFAYEYDLGQEWWALTHLPFVFAVWAARPGVATDELARVLRRSLALGMAHLDLIAAEAARSLELDEALVSNYLRRMLRYELTDRAWEGMGRFWRYCVAMKLCPATAPRDLARRLGV